MVHKRLDVPLIAVTYEESQESLNKYFREYFPESWGGVNIGRNTKSGVLKI
ncbi:MAG: hypothetical protein ACFFBS_04680 [Promethearchaeota archaeon]